MRYFPLTDADREEMRKVIGIKESRELFADLPQDKIYYSLADLPPALAEDELIRTFSAMARKNEYPDYLSFLGGGAYSHFIPEVVNQLSSRGEFITPYTPYQPEVSQGSLQAMFEYQTMITMLTGLDVSNASLYDGGTAAAEGALLVLRKAKKNRILVAANLHPEYIEIIRTYIHNLDFRLETVDFSRETGAVNLDDLSGKLDEQTAGFIFQSPNFFGVVEEGQKIADLVHGKKAYAVQVIAEAMSLPFLRSPGQDNVDIAVGEAQSFGLPLGFGGPYLGFMAAKEEFIRQMPGRIVGQTVDREGKRGYVLTLSTREQHIKREKATSNICSNEAWCALRAAMYLATLGRKGLLEVSRINHLNTAYFAREIGKNPKFAVRFPKNFYNEVVLQVKNMKIEDFVHKMQDRKILAGIPLKWFFPEYPDSLLVNFTESHTKADIDRLLKALGELS